jgi:hypothetical protein
MYPPFEGEQGRADRAARDAARLASAIEGPVPATLNPQRPYFAPVEPMVWEEPRDRRVLHRTLWSNAFVWMGKDMAAKLLKSMNLPQLPRNT